LIRDAIRNSEAEIVFRVEVDQLIFDVKGTGDPRLELSHSTDIVIRKSDYVCDRTLMINADKAACDIDQDIVRLLMDHQKKIFIEIQVNL
jgi:hypothetical protein